jgi:lipopolysaccharide export system protein LptA
MMVGRAAFPVVSGLLFMLFFYAAGKAQTRTGTANQAENTRITADRLLVDRDAKYAEFAGAVKLTQGGTVLTADRLKIFFEADRRSTQIAPGDQESIKKIVANGNVRIKLDEGSAEADRAEFIAETNTYILSGEGSKVISGKNSISGSRITLHRTDGRITVERGAEKRVEAVIFSEKKGDR